MIPSNSFGLLDLAHPSIIMSDSTHHGSSQVIHPTIDDQPITTTTIDPPVARLEASSYEIGHQEIQRLSEQEAIESSRGESVWKLENEQLLNEFKEGTEEIDLSHSRIRTLRGFESHLDRLAASLKRLNLRQNLIKKLKLSQASLDSQSKSSSDHHPQQQEQPAERIGPQDHDEIGLSPFEPLESLQELDLYDNQISKIEGLDKLKSLISLDLSFNLIRKIENLADLSSLTTLYLIQNKISQIEGLERLADKLISLELGSNRIRHINNLTLLTNLTELWLGRNKISKLEGLETLVNLRSLSIQSNRIVKLEGLEKLIKLEELYISHNGLTKIGDGLSKNKNLKVLDVGANQIDDLSGIEGLFKLEELWANNNKLTTNGWYSIAEAVSEKSMPSLQTIYLEGNPLQQEMGANYRRKIILSCPQIIQIDATFVKS